MKKVVIVLCAALTLAGCQTGSTLGNFTSFVTTGVANPVTKQDLYNFENGMIVIFAGLKAYRQACVAGAVDVSCKSNIRAMQVYTKQLPPLLAQARRFVKNNDQVNAAVVFNQAKDLYATLKAMAISNGVSVQ